MAGWNGKGSTPRPKGNGLDDKGKQLVKLNEQIFEMNRTKQPEEEINKLREERDNLKNGN